MLPYLSSPYQCHFALYSDIVHYVNVCDSFKLNNAFTSKHFNDYHKCLNKHIKIEILYIM